LKKQGSYNFLCTHKNQGSSFEEKRFFYFLKFKNYIFLIHSHFSIY